jgi:signal transduction histidine kinase
MGGQDTGGDDTGDGDRRDKRVDPTLVEQLAHSLRNPLEVAMVHTDIAQEQEDTDHLNAVREAHGRIEEIIEDATRVAKHDSDALEQVPVDIGAVAEDAWSTVPTEDHSLTVEATGEVVADERRLRELLENLFRNAVEHGTGDPADSDSAESTPTPGAPDAVTVTIGGMDDGLYIADDGRGIPGDDPERVLAAGYSTADDGTGLGLAIVDSIVRAHGWELSVSESAQGGARFEITTESQ